MKPLISLSNISKVINDRVILKDLNFEVFEGDFISIVGESGAGKTTLLGVVSLLDKEFEGKYQLENQDIHDYNDSQLAKQRNQKIGFIMQDFLLIENYTVYQNIFIPLLYAKEKKNKNEIKVKIKRLIDEFGLSGKENQRVSTLSGGERQRVAIIRAIINDPQIIIADEPTSALDSENSKYICGILEGLNQKGKTIIVVTHNNREVQIAKRNYVLKNGCLLIS